MKTYLEDRSGSSKLIIDCRYDIGIFFIKVSVFYSPGNHHIGENYVRFCFFKQEESLNKVEEILSSLNVEN